VIEVGMSMGLEWGWIANWISPSPRQPQTN